jgi:hypothetical protein
MTYTISRLAAIAGATVFLSTAGLVAGLDAANALTVSGGTYTQVIKLDANETAQAAAGSSSAATLCTAVIQQAKDRNTPLSAAAQTHCANSLLKCAQWAQAYGHEYVGIEFTGSTGVPRCLRPEDMAS